jgi:CBS-domain-containing membrane protein
MMEPGPSTVRPNTHATRLARRLAARDLKTAIVTTPGGVLLGVVRRCEVEAALAQASGRPVTA